MPVQVHGYGGLKVGIVSRACKAGQKDRSSWDENGLSRCIFSTPELACCAYLASRMVKEPKTAEGLFISAR